MDTPKRPLTLDEVIELGDRLIHEAFPSRTNALSDAVDDENARRAAAAKAYKEETIKLADGSKLEYGGFYDLTLDGGTWRAQLARSMRGCRFDGRDPSGQLVVTRYGATRMKSGFDRYDRPAIIRIYSADRVLHAEPVKPSEKLLASIEEARLRDEERERKAEEWRAAQRAAVAAERGS